MPGACFTYPLLRHRRQPAAARALAAAMPNRIGITGASGCGVTTLGQALAARLGAVHIDTDDHYWVETDPPYREKRDVAERMENLASRS